MYLREEPRVVSQYARKDVLRMLRLPARQLEIWERAGLIAPAEAYAFDSVSQLRKLRELAATRISAKSIRRSVEAMQRVAGLANPLSEAVIAPHRSRVAFRQGGALVDPFTTQLAFDFDMRGAGESRVLQRLCPRAAVASMELQDLFQRAVRLEERPETLADAKRLYAKLLDMAPDHAASAINLGTICYNERDYDRAERLYRSATEADPDYALAFFDLGNVLDEQARLSEAIDAYQRALTLVPDYADAHYNLALAFERQGERRKALRHWTEYTRLDPSGPWSSHARSQARRILSSERLTIVSRHGRTMRVTA
jgi:tetratricopeptide (TPR) repeat protein